MFHNVSKCFISSLDPRFMGGLLFSYCMYPKIIKERNSNSLQNLYYYYYETNIKGRGGGQKYHTTIHSDIDV